MNALWDRWIELWNGDLALAEEIIHPEFALHRIPPPRIPDGVAVEAHASARRATTSGGPRAG